MRRSRQLAASAVVSLSLIVSSTAAAASPAPPPALSTNPWMTLSMLNPSGAAVLAGAGVSAVQPASAPEPQQYTGSSTPPLPVIAVWLAVIVLDIYLLTRHDRGGTPNSPT